MRRRQTVEASRRGDNRSPNPLLEVSGSCLRPPYRRGPTLKGLRRFFDPPQLPNAGKMARA